MDHRAQKKTYTDPQIFPTRDWKDEYQYDANDRLTGWTRTRSAGITEFSRHGAIIIEKDNKGRPTKAEKIGYLYARDKQGRLSVTEKPMNEFLVYHYLDDKDTQGILVK